MKYIEDRFELIERLRQQPFVPYNVIGILENTENAVYSTNSVDSVWVENGYFNYICGAPEIILERIHSLEDGFYGFSGVEGHLAEAVYGNYLLHWYEPTDRYVYRGGLKEAVSPYEVFKVPIEEAEGIDARYEYQDETSLEKIKMAILNRPSSCLYLKGELASYVLVHEDNSIGFMYTADAHRKEGLAYWVTRDILEKMLNLEKIPFVEINWRNFKSQGLAAKTELIKDAFTPWFGIIKGTPEWFNEMRPYGDNPFVFTTLAQLRVAEGVKSNIKPPIFIKVENGYKFKLTDEERDICAEALLKLDESGEAYILEVISRQNVADYELIKSLAVFFPEENASLIVPYSEELKSQFRGIVGKPVSQFVE